MSAYCKIIKTDIDIPTLVDKLDSLYPPSSYDSDSASVSDYESFPLSPTYHKNVYDLPKDIKELFEKNVNCPFMDYFFLWDWRRATTILEPHVDPIKKQSFNNVVARISAFINLESTFNLNFHNKEGEIVEELVYETGDIVVINNTQVAHSGKLLSKGNKRAIAGYPDIPQNKIDGEEVPFISIDELCKV